MKKQLRKQFSLSRDSLTHKEALIYSQQMTQSLMGMPEIQSAKIIASFVSFKSEIQMNSFNQWVIDHKKTLLLPKVDYSHQQIRFFEVTAMETLKRGHYGILEPDEILCKPYDPQKIDVIISPGLAFDKHGYRLGYGGGYYDRLFNTPSVQAVRIGVGYDLQYTDILPHEAFDLPVHYFVSETKIRSFK